METRPIRRLMRPPGGHLLFALAATAACIVAPLLPLQTDSAYTFFRLLQQPALNIDDLRTLNPLTWAAMQAGVRLAAAPRTLALVFALSQVGFAYLVFLIGRYGFRYRRADRFALALALVSAPLWLNPANGTLNGLGYFALAYMLLAGERRSKADTHQPGAAGRLPATLRYVILAGLLLLCVFADPTWLLAIAFWLLCRPDETATDRPGRFPWPRVALIAFLALSVWLDRRLLPQPLEFTSDFFLPVYGFRNAFAFWTQTQAYAHLFLWAGWAYLAARYVCRKAYRPLAALLILTAVWLALFGFTPGYAADFGRRFLPFWVITALLILKEKQPAVWLAPALLFLVCGTADEYKTLNRRATFYATFAENLPQPYEKFLAYNVPMPEYSFQPSGLPQVEMLNYTLLHTSRPRIVAFPLPGMPFQSPYEADLSLQVTDGLSWPSNLLNPNYFHTLYAKGSIGILPADFFAFRPIYGLLCPAEAYARDRANKAFFICETWPDSAEGLTGGPELVELRTTECAFSGEACVKVSGKAWEALTVPLNVLPGDSLFVNVKRKGNGRLCVENFYLYRQKARAIAFRIETDQAVRRLPAVKTLQTQDAPATETPAPSADTVATEYWDHLEIRTLIPPGVQRVLIHVTTDSARNTSYFDDLEIIQWRRPFQGQTKNFR
ncbi:MAG: hypothetical protein K2O01_00690 [Bacteroidales bacterium]|nr:hypothetical protein [Bacteroidales bacterium]